MPSTNPTWDEFLALEARVAALEKPGGETGVQARRVVELCRLGVNTFSSLDEHNRWGSWPADYRPESVIDALRWIVQDTGHVINVREYHYKGREEMQIPWFQQLVTAFPAMQNMMCVGANGSVNDVASMVAMQADASTNVAWIEGSNEPNTNFGSGEVKYETTLAVQNAVWDTGQRGAILGPSIVAGTPHPEGWITGYCGGQEGVDALSQDIGNGHYYPPASPDVGGTGYSVSEYIDGLVLAYGAPIALTEYHPSLYNSQGHKPGQPGWSGARDAYYLLTTLFRCASVAHSLWWYALYDYGTTYTCGLFPQYNAEEPREAAYALRALCALCPDRGPNARTFAPGRLDFTVTGGDASVSHDLYQSSDGTFFIVLWRSLPEPGGEPIAVTVTCPAGMLIDEYDLSRLAADRVAGDYRPVQETDTALTVALDGSAMVLRVTA